MNRLSKRCGLVAVYLVVVFIEGSIARGEVPSGVHDLSLLVSPAYPCVWPIGMQQHVVVPSRTFGPGAYHRDLVIIDEHTGTQWDAPAHFVPPPTSGLPGAGPMGLITGDKVPAWQFAGEACIIDVREHTDSAPAGSSYLISSDIVKSWEASHRKLQFGDAVLFRSDYTDRYYKPFTEGGARFVETALRNETPGWPAPKPECMEYLASCGVRTLGLDGASMGPLPDLAVQTHQAGGKHGMVWIECGTNLGSLPETGAAFVILSPKHARGSGNEVRAIGVTDPTKASHIIGAVRAKSVIDLSVVMDDSLPVTWPGRGPGDEASRYISQTLNAFDPARGPYFARTHALDAMAGTHVVPPSYSIPPPGFDRQRYSPEIRKAVEDFESRFGALGTSDMTVDKIPLESMMGEAHVIDVSPLVGKQSKGSPTVSLDFVKEHEKTRPITAGQVVIFSSGYTDRYFKPLPPQPQKDRFMVAPLAGDVEGWPAVSAEVVAYLATKGIRCVGTDSPSLGSVDDKEARETYWAAGKNGVLILEMLTAVASIPNEGALVVFAPVKIAGTHGGYGRALAFP